MGQLRSGPGASVWSVATNSAQLRSNYNPTTDRLLDTSKASWAVVAGNAAADRFAVFRAPATAGSPTYALMGSIDAAGNFAVVGTADFPQGFTGVHLAPLTRLSRATAVSTPSGSSATLSFPVLDYSAYGFTTVAGADSILIPADEGGVYEVKGYVEWATNGTGYRRLEIAITGSGVTLVSDSRAAVSGSPTRASAAVEYAVSAGTVIAVTATQTSGGALDVINASFSARRVA